MKFEYSKGKTHLLIKHLSHLGVSIFVENGKLKASAKENSLTKDIITLIADNKSEILAYISSASEPKNNIKKISPQFLKKTMASYSQQRLWLLDKIGEGSAHYNIPSAIRLTGYLNIDALNRAFLSLIDRHESLRTRFISGDDGQPFQVIESAKTFQAPVINISHLSEKAREARMAEVTQEEASRKFDLSQDLMLRVKLLKLADNDHLLLVTMHHIASDGWSMSILINEFSALYEAFSEGQANPLEPLAIQYADYAHWQREWLQGEVLDQQLAYWEKQLVDLPIVHNIPLDHPRPHTQTYTGQTYHTRVDEETSCSLSKLCRTEGATLFMGLHAAFSILLSRYSNETDIVVGSPIANREQVEVEGLIGFFVNNLVLRSDLTGNPTFIELLNQSKCTLQDAYAHQQVPFEQIVERLQPKRSTSHSPLFQVMLVLQNNEQGSLKLSGLTLRSVGRVNDIAKYDLTLNVNESDKGLRLGWGYNTDLFEASSIERMSIHFKVLLKELIASPDECVFKAEMLPYAERYKLLVEWNDTFIKYPKDKCIQELFEEQVAVNPEAVAVIFEDQELTYGELNKRSNQLAHYLVKERGVKPDTLVGVCVERSLELVIGIVGVLKSGGAYVPLDPDYPEARIKVMLEDANLNTVLTQSQVKERTHIGSEQAICFDDELFQKYLTQQPTGNLNKKQLGLHSNHLAYVIYTSGSAGKPKGVMIEHKSLVNYLLSIKRYTVNTLSSFISTNICFDGTATSFWSSLVSGKYIEIPSISENPIDALVNEIKLNNTPKLIKLTPAHIEAIESSKIINNYGDVVFIGGDKLTPRHVEIIKNFGFSRVINHYGPSEASVGCSVYEVDLRKNYSKASIPIGKPLGNVTLYVVNLKNHICPIGVRGELCIGGPGLSRGYLNNVELTAEKFINNPFYDPLDPNSSKRLYKTGDFARWLPDGNLEYMGRIDNQVKIRGFRVEIGDIEHHLSTSPDINTAVVMINKDPFGNNYIVAFATTIDIFGERLSVLTDEEIKVSLVKHLENLIPIYMIPDRFILMDKFPVTSNGKIDKNQLSSIKITSKKINVTPPCSDIEIELSKIWASILGCGISEVGLESDFFEMGGNSMLAAKLTFEVNKAFNINLKLLSIFKSKRFLDISSYIESEAKSI